MQLEIKINLPENNKSIGHFVWKYLQESAYQCLTHWNDILKSGRQICDEDKEIVSLKILK